MKRILVAVGLLCLLATGAQPYWQSRLQVGVTAGASYSGPGDSKTFIQWGSVARVYNAAAASTSTQMADLVQGPSGASPGTAVGTLRGSASGLVDLTGYFAGGVTPATACGLITGGCVISKLYDQVGGNHWVEGTGSKRPSLTFAAINGLPTMTFVSANFQTLVSQSSVSSQNEAYTFEIVGQRPVDDGAKHTAFANGNGGGATLLWPDFNDAMRIGLNNQFDTTQTILDTSFHVAQGTFLDVTSTLVVDAVTFTGDTGLAQAMSSTTTIGSFADVVQYLNGKISEAGFYAGTENSGVQTNACTAYGLGTC